MRSRTCLAPVDRHKHIRIGRTVDTMKLMMICDYPLTPSDINGGVAAAAYNLVQSLLKHTDVNIVVIGFWPDFNEDRPKVIEDGRLKVIRCPPALPRAHLRNYRLERRIFNHYIARERPDVIHAQSEGIYASVATNSGRPNVYTIHGIRLKELDMEKSEIGIISHFLRSRLILQHHKKASNIIAINRYTEKAINGLHNARLRIIHNAVDNSYFDLYDETPTQPGKLLLVGGVRQRKDIVTAVSAINELTKHGKEITLDITGPNEAEYLEHVRSLVERYDLQKQVTVHGLVSSRVLETLYKSADIFVMSSVEESSPISIVQAMACGKPVVSTDVGGIAEMISHGENGFLVAAGDYAAMADSIQRLIEDRDMHRQFCSKSRQIAVDNWSAKAVALETYDMYKEIMSES